MTEIKLALTIIGGIVVLTLIAAVVVCKLEPAATKDVILAAIGVASSAITGILGWMGRGLYEAVKAKLGIDTPEPEVAK